MTKTQTSAYVSQVHLFKQQKRKRSQLNFGKGMLFLFPSLLLFSVFLFYPMARTLYLSFFLTDNRGMATVFVGFENFARIFSSDLFIKSLTSTFLFVLYTVPGTILIALFLAILANEKLRGIGIFRMIFSSTMGISVAAASVFWLFLFHPSIGFLNQILSWFGVGAIGWLTDPSWALFSVSISTIWMNLGFTFF